MLNYAKITFINYVFYAGRDFFCRCALAGLVAVHRSACDQASPEVLHFKNIFRIFVADSSPQILTSKISAST
jgi:hypothetical protein